MIQVDGIHRGVDNQRCTLFRHVDVVNKEVSFIKAADSLSFLNGLTHLNFFKEFVFLSLSIPLFYCSFITCQSWPLIYFLQSLSSQLSSELTSE